MGRGGGRGEAEGGTGRHLLAAFSRRADDDNEKIDLHCLTFGFWLLACYFRPSTFGLQPVDFWLWTFDC